MPARIYKSQLVFISLLGFLTSLRGTAQDLSSLDSRSVEFERSSTKIVAESPNKKSAVVLLPPVNEEADPKIEAHSKGRTIRLGSLQRSASVFWRRDSKAAALWDRAYSDHFFVRLIAVSPELHEVKGFDQMIKTRVLKEFHPPGNELVHYWPYIEGWTKQNQLLVVACVDGAPRRNTTAPLTYFEHGYLINISPPKISSELNILAASKLIGKNPCGD